MAVVINASQNQVLLRGCRGIEVLHGLPCRKLHSRKRQASISGGQLMLAPDQASGRVRWNNWLLVNVKMSPRRGRS